MDNTKEVQLKPCPFCGGEAEIKQEGRNGLLLRCSKCYVGFKQKVIRLSLDWLRETLIGNWNSRV